jgi:hypothetical protein
MEADHQNMVRFKSRDDRNYQRLVGTLQRWVKELDVPADDINVVARPSIWFSQNVVQTPLPQNTAPLELDANPSLTPRQSVPLSMVTDEDLYSQSDVPQSGLRHVRQSQRIPRQPTSQSSHQRQETCQLPKNTTTAVDQTLEVESEDYSDVEEEEEEEEVVLPPPHPKRASRPQISQTQGLSVPIVIPPDLSKLGSVIFQGTSQLQMAYNMGTMNLSFHS